MSETGLSEEVARLLRCPATHQTLRQARPEELLPFGDEFPEGGFITEDGNRVYPVQSGFPILVVNSSKRLNG
tara:strand:+ start:58 stop:273 length:216 start_codon:yes stop_codon:yes gene_type:complete